jgi:tyrosine-protein kinase Etk/Wzc
LYPGPDAITMSEHPLGVEHAAAREEGFDVLEVFLILARHSRLIATTTVLFAIVGLACTSFMSKRYTATASFLVDQDTVAQTGLILYRQSDPTISLLQSEAIATFVLQNTGEEIFAKGEKPGAMKGVSLTSLAKRIRSESTASKSGEGLYVLTVEDTLPERSVAIANAYLEALQDLGDRMNFESATRTREFYQRQLESERADLENAEAELKKAQERTGLLQPGSQTSIQLNQIAQLRAQIVALEVQRSMLQQSATSENPEMVRLTSQLTQLQSTVASLQAKINSPTSQNIATQDLEVGRLQRAVDYHQGLLTSLAAQYDRARIQETYRVPRVRVVDRAALPAPKTAPKRGLITVFSMAFGLFLGMVLTGLLVMKEKLSRDPVASRKLREIRKSLLLRKA